MRPRIVTVTLTQQEADALFTAGMTLDSAPYEAKLDIFKSGYGVRAYQRAMQKLSVAAMVEPPAS